MKNIHVLSFKKIAEMQCALLQHDVFFIALYTCRLIGTRRVSLTEQKPFRDTFRFSVVFVLLNLQFSMQYFLLFYVFLSLFAIIALPSIVFLFTAPDCHCGWHLSLYFFFCFGTPCFNIVIHPVNRSEISSSVGILSDFSYRTSIPSRNKPA